VVDAVERREDPGREPGLAAALYELDQRVQVEAGVGRQGLGERGRERRRKQLLATPTEDTAVEPFRADEMQSGLECHVRE